MKKIGIMGSGTVAQTLGTGFLKHGYTVMLGTRNPQKLKQWQAENGKDARVGSFAETAEFGDLIVLAVKGTAALTVMQSTSAKHLEGKTVMDATNPIAEAPPQNGVLQYFTSQNESLMEQLQANFPKAHFVKAFNSVGSAKMVNPVFETKPTMFICGNDNNAKKEVGVITEQLGWEVEDMGAAEAARAIEPLAMLWCIPGFRHNQWTHAFKLLK